MSPARCEIKICGIRTAETASAAVDAGADRIGLVFVPGSPRFVSLEESRAVVDALDGRAEPVGVFKDMDVAALRTIRNGVPLGRVQLHGSVTAEMVSEVAPVPVVVALAFDRDGLPAALARWQQAAAALPNLAGLLIDTPDPTRLGGGTGMTFDWDELRAIFDRHGIDLPIHLAGGLTPDNVAEAIRIVRPAGVDVSTGVESQRGVKDPERIRAFCEAVGRLTHGSGGAGAVD